MNRYLCISITFLDPLFHGKGDGDKPEWPPSPLRLFQALVAGSHIGSRKLDWSTGKAEAFRWLETRDAPHILAPEARVASAYTFYVPNNDGDRKFVRQDRLTSKVARPHRLTNDQTLHYLWPVPDTEWASVRHHVDRLCAEARHVLALGWGIDHVVGNGLVLSAEQVAGLPGVRWRPWGGHGAWRTTHRVPKCGTFDDLKDVYQSFLDSVGSSQYQPRRKVHVFGTVTYMAQTAWPPRPCAVFELPEGVAFPQREVVSVAAMLRSLICRSEHRRDFQELFNDNSEVYLAGHVKNRRSTPPRFSYLPLPTVGHEHADGMVRRLLIAEPYGEDGTHARWAQQRLQNRMLVDKDGNDAGVLLEPWRQSSSKMIERYVEPARAWTTVTPVILPGYDDFKSPRKHDETRPLKAEKLLLKALWQAGIPPDALSDLSLRKAPFWPGSQHPTRYRRPNYLKHLPAWHVYLQFHDPIPGPLAIGAGRHCGLGIFAVEPGSTS